MHIGSGSDWRFLGYNPGSSTMTHNGVFDGERGLDYSSVFNGPPSMNDDDTHYAHFSFTTSTTPTAYPLKIVTYQAQSPQDTNFVVLNFVYTINGVETTAFTFTPLKGTNIGNGIWDLDNVWNGCYLTYGYPTTESVVSIRVRAPNERYYVRRMHKVMQLEEKHSMDTLEMPKMSTLMSGLRVTLITFIELQVITVRILLGTIEIAPMMITL